MSYSQCFIETDLSKASFQSACDLSPGGLPAVQSFENYIGALSGGLENATLTFSVGMVQAQGYFTFASVVATDVFTINGVDFTCVASGAGANQFNVGMDDAETCENAAAAVNASVTALVAGVVTAEARTVGMAERVYITAVVPGVGGNLITLADSDSTISESGARLTGGSQGTVTTVNLGR